MESFLQDLTDEIHSIQSFCDQKRSQDSVDDHSLLDKSVKNCKDAQIVVETLVQSDLTLPLADSTMDRINNALSLYVQALLDQTYYNECKLLDQNFLVTNADDVVQSIVDELNKPFKLEEKLRTMYSAGKDIFSIEIKECLFWRCGALIYMFCHTIKNTKKNLNSPGNRILQLLKIGIAFLIRMLNIRKAPNSDDKDEDIVYNDEATFKLIKQGIYSDTHVLAYAYAGEMCYWHCYYFKDDAIQKEQITVSSNIGSQTCNNNNDEHLNRYSEISSNIILSKFNFRTNGLALLDQYLNVVNGPLKSYGWDSKKIEIMRNILQSQN
ncbi:UPF0600 protein C5orf51-like protein [Trichoplax sp. H2]|nr:UPF0600 protein C5orf51-like protein [Trichoplax sp. H2]|eukprot:RDD40235.1 UPF0600 protein C5orf51-like protein [Trichoplax sp. H2]